MVSAAALAHPPSYRRARAVAHYNDRLRDLVHGLKYADQQHGGRLFGRWLAVAGKDLIADADVIVPVPLARFRLWRRRFNQAAVLSQRLAMVTGITYAPMALKRTKATTSQVGLTSEQRRRNVQGAFQVPDRARSHIEGRQVLLVDDVVTNRLNRRLGLQGPPRGRGGGRGYLDPCPGHRGDPRVGLNPSAVAEAPGSPYIYPRCSSMVVGR